MRLICLTGVVLLVVNASAVEAQTVVSGTLNAALGEGSLAGTTFPVTFSYDAARVASVGESLVPLLSFNFTLGGVAFTRDDIFQGGQAIFSNGVFENVTASFQVVLPPNSPVLNITFGFGGRGVIGSTDLNNQSGRGSFTLQPVGWRSDDIGDVGVSGTAFEDSGVWTIEGAGADIWGSADAFHFLYRQTNLQDGRLVVRVNDLQDTNPFAKSGLMLRAVVNGRDPLDASAPTVILDMKPTGEIELMSRATYGADMVYWAGAVITAPVWLRFDWASRDGGSVSGYVSQDGVTWTLVSGISFATSESWIVGVAVTSHTTTELTTSHVEGLSLTPLAWTNTDIGSTGVTGSAVLENTALSSFTIQGAGADIWDVSDSFQFLYRTATTFAATVQARVVSEQATDPYAKAGVMIRDGLAPGATFVLLDMKPNGELEFMQRFSPGGAVTYLGGQMVGFNTWIRLVRHEPTDLAAVTAEVSADGVNWMIIGRTLVNMSVAVQMGVGVTSHDTAQLNTAIVDHVLAGNSASTITFDGLTTNGAPVTSYDEAGFTVVPTSAAWVARTTYGNPAPFVQFVAPAGTTVAGEVRVTSGGGLFSFASVDVYSSTTPIPYVITGFRDASTVFTLAGTIPNTFGQFRTITNPDSLDSIDTLSILLTNGSAPCCSNPMGLDNIVVVR